MGKPDPRATPDTDSIDVLDSTTPPSAGLLAHPTGLARTPASPTLLAEASTTSVAATLTKAPPQTNPRTIKVQKQRTVSMDIDVMVRVLADTISSSATMIGAATRYDPANVSWRAPSYNWEMRAGDKVVTRLNGLLELKGTITIQTTYAPSAKATDASLYGRGTTANDIRSGNTSLGFHEACHRQDYLQYLRDTALPVFSGKAGMTVTAFERAVKQFDAAFKKYFTDMGSRSEQNTDEVGYTKSRCKRDGKCH